MMWEMAGESLPCLRSLNEVKWMAGEDTITPIIIWRESEVLAGDDDVGYPPFNDIHHTFSIA